jgi:hypothetical protein
MLDTICFNIYIYIYTWIWCWVAPMGVHISLCVPVLLWCITQRKYVGLYWYIHIYIYNHFFHLECSCYSICYHQSIYLIMHSLQQAMHDPVIPHINYECLHFHHIFNTSACSHAYMCTSTHAWINMFKYIYIYKYIYMHMCISWCIHQHIHIHSWISASVCTLYCCVLVCIYVSIIHSYIDANMQYCLLLCGCVHMHTFVHSCMHT